MKTKYKDTITVDWDHDEVFITIEETTEDRMAVAGMTVDQALKLQSQLTAAIRKAVRPMPAATKAVPDPEPEPEEAP